MEELRLNRKDGLFIAICLLILAGGLWVGLKYFYKAFPEATIDFRYNRAESGDIAARFWDSFGEKPPADFRLASRFGYDGQAKTYLEKELGVEGAKPFLGHPIRLWYWQHRWFRPSTKEEFRVFVTPEGELVRVDHQIEENAAGADISEDSARAMAERFLFGAMKQDPAKLTFLESERVGRPHRADWTFTYKATGIEPVKGSDYRYSVGLLGDHIGSYREFLHIPEAWQASYKKLRSFNEMAGSVDGVGFVLTIVALLSVFLIRSRRRDIRWRTAALFGIVAAGLALLNRLNDFPVNLYWYDTTSSWSGFLTDEVLMTLLSVFAQGAAIFLLTAAAEPLYRERYGNKLALSRMFGVHALRTKSAFRSILLGITLTSFFFAYQIVFYLVADHFGAWSPSDVPYDDLLNTAIPWVAVLMMGFFPAVSEEFMSRMFSIPFLQKAFRGKMTWLALLIPALIWGFGHVGYVNQPFWIRGAEVGIAGIIIGIIMLKFGILAALVWHYTVDALYTALLLFRSNNPYFMLTAYVAVGLLVIPLLIAFIAYLRKGAFLPEAGVRNQDLAAPAPEPQAVIAPPEPAAVSAAAAYRRLPRENRVLGLVLLGVGIVAALMSVAKIGDFLSYPVTKQQAIKTFSDSLRSTGWANPDTLRIAAFINEEEGIGSANPLCYLLKHTESVEQFNQIANGRLGVGRWRVNAWKPENRLKYSGSVNSRSGRIESLYPIFPEEMPGDSLGKDSALALAGPMLAARGEDLSRLELKEYEQHKRPHRLDHNLIYEAREGDPRHVGEAKYRRGANVDGSTVSLSARAFYKVPEDWQRDRQATTVLRALRRGLPIVVMTGVILWMIVMLVLRTRQGVVPWKKAFVIAMVPGVIAAISGLNQFYLSLQSYFSSVEVPWAVFRSETVIGWLLSAAGGYGLFVVAVALLGGLFPDQFTFLHARERRAAIADSCFAAAAGLGAWLFTRSLSGFLAAWHPDWILFSGWGVPSWLAAPLPLTLLVSGALARAIILAVLAAFFVWLWMVPMRKPLQRVLLAIMVLFFLLPTGNTEAFEWLTELLLSAVVVLLAWVVLRFVVAGRPAPLFAAAVAIAVASKAVDVLGSGNTSLVVQGWIFVALALLALLYWLGLFRRLPSAR